MKQALAPEQLAQVSAAHTSGFGKPGLRARLAPEIALRAPPVVGVALLAPPARAPWDAVVEQ